MGNCLGALIEMWLPSIAPTAYGILAFLLNFFAIVLNLALPLGNLLNLKEY